MTLEQYVALGVVIGACLGVLVAVVTTLRWCEREDEEYQDDPRMYPWV